LPIEDYPEAVLVFRFSEMTWLRVLFFFPPGFWPKAEQLSIPEQGECLLVNIHTPMNRSFYAYA